MSSVRRQELDVRTDREERLLCVSYQDGTQISLYLCSGQTGYYVMPRVKRPGETASTDLTKHVMHVLLRWLCFDIQGVRYMLEIRIAE